MNNSRIEYLVGKKSQLHNTLKPFSEEVVSFLDDLSRSINSKKNLNIFPDIKALAFFCRKQNILNFKKKYYNPKRIRFGLGLIFHITPSNIPTNFMYSLIFGLISGNANIVKVPSRKFDEIKIICEEIKYLLRKRKHLRVKKMIQILRYDSKENQITNDISEISDARLIWGGDKTIKEIRKIETKARTIDVPFADRYSISLINSNKLLQLPNYKFNILLKNFYNDTYEVDQNACSSPHIILWQGDKTQDAKKKFWNNLNLLVEKNYNPPAISSIDNYCRLSKELIENNNIHSFKLFNKALYVVKLKKINPEIFVEKSKWGFFYECNINNLKNINYLVKKKLQTITYFGYQKKFLEKFFGEYNFNGIDRIVPIGQALNINLVWDGYDLTNKLSREIEIR
ncbi:hypothetical protein N9570_04725 [Candidatus Pelagibacter sp.]|nr:hypothetical protein [Candidatus Pelagibacter sp.]